MPASSRRYAHAKAGVMQDDLLPIKERPLTLFEPLIAREGFNNRSGIRHQYRLPRYTTRISDVPVIRK